MTYKPITEYTEQELAAMRCWEIIHCHLQWNRKENPFLGTKTKADKPLPEPYAAIYQQALEDLAVILKSEKVSEHSGKTPFRTRTTEGPETLSRAQLSEQRTEMEAWMDAHYDEIFPPEQPK